MGYEEILESPTPLAPRKDRSRIEALRRPTGETTPAHDTGRLAPLGSRRPLRFGGLSLDALTGRVQWRGRSVPLDEDEIEVLQALMQNAGRILSTEQLADELADEPESVEQRLRSLHGTLRVAGVKCLPRRANGLGYILWC